jgi:hypothetical protein
MNSKIYLIAFALVAACASTPEAGPEMSPEDIAQLEEVDKYRTQTTGRDLLYLSKEEMRVALEAWITDRTEEIYQEGYGVYVEYTAPDHRFFQWFPSNPEVIVGVWQISDDFERPEVCYQYLDASNPVTGEFEPNECISTYRILGSVGTLQTRQGDTFNLMSGKIPYVKSKNTRVVWPENTTDEEGAAE